MAKFHLLYYTPTDKAWDKQDIPEEEKMESMNAWMAWKEKAGDAIVDFGAPLMPGKCAVSGEGCEGTCEKVMSGYSIIEVDSFEVAQELLADHPHLAWDPGCSIKVLEHVDMSA